MGELKAPIGANTAHLCIDMQRLFSDEGPWPMAWMPRVTPKVEQLFARAPERTIFTRFIPPERSENAPGRWRVYYEKWSHVDGQNFKLALGRSFWPLLVEERHEIEKLFRNDELRRLLTQGEDRDDHADVRMIDAAYWRKGCSSLGHLRYAVLLQIRRKSDRRRHCLLDLKEAVKPKAPHAAGGMPRDYARRVITGASHLSPYLGRPHASG